MNLELNHTLACCTCFTLNCCVLSRHAYTHAAVQSAVSVCGGLSAVTQADSKDRHKLQCTVCL